MVRSFLAVVAPVVLVVACSAPAPSVEAQSSDALKGCYGQASSSVPADGRYYLTTFGGPSESQPLSCGGSSNSGSWYYAASKQRYGCGAHLRIEANGRCVVAQAADYGPDVCVEKASGRPVLDASPLVGKVLFGEPNLGWSDRAAVTVTQVANATPLGPCKAPSPSPSPSPPAHDAGASPAKSCSSEGDCNPGNDGAGKICAAHVCVAGCHSDAQCPGNTSCLGGFCK